MSCSRRQLFGVLALVFAFGGGLATVILFAKRETKSSESPVSSSESATSKVSQISKVPQIEPGITVVNGSDKWRDTGIRVNKGQIVSITANGTITWAPPGITDGTNVVGPNGTRPPYTRDAARFPIPEAGIGSLVMRIGRLKYAVGSGDRIEAKESGTIELMINDDVVGDNSGSFTVNITVK
jgi:hypothetical protein